MLKPIFPISKEYTSKESAKILFFIDNSRSMQLEGSSGSLFEEAKNKFNPMNLNYSTIKSDGVVTYF